MKLHLLSVLLIMFIAPQTMSAQTPRPVQDFSANPRAYTNRASFWTEFNINGTISKNGKWQYGIDYQYRRMSDANYITGGNNSNLFKDPYQQVVRPWFHYRIAENKIRFSLSPVGIWYTWTPSAEPASNPQDSKARLVFPEIRTSLQFTYTTRAGRVEFSQRARYEFRWIGSRNESTGFINDLSKGFDFENRGTYGSNQKGRLRYQVRMMIPFNHKTLDKNTWYANVWDELFISTGKNVGNSNILDQNRFVALLGYKFNSDYPVRLELGYTLQSIFKYNMDAPPTQPDITYNKNNVELNSALQVYVIFEEFQKIFQKKDKIKKA